MCEFGYGLGADVVARKEHFGQHQQVNVLGLLGNFTQTLQIARDIQWQRPALVKGDAHGVLLVLSVCVGAGLIAMASTRYA